MPPPVSLRTIVYVDGFNFYYGVLKNTPYKWLDLERFYTLLLPHDRIQTIKFFTSLVGPGPHRVRQDTLLKALRTCAPMVEVILGRFKTKKVVCRNCTGSTRRVPEEKRTDVNIGIHMIDDAHRGRCEQQVVVSGDSDLVPAVRMVREGFPQIKTTVYIPARTKQRGAAAELREAADRSNHVPLQLLPLAQLPPRIPDGVGGFIEKPAEW